DQIVISGTFATNVPGNSSLNRNALLAGAPGNLSILLRQGSQVPGLPAGTNWGGPLTDIGALNDSGYMSGLSGLQDPVGTFTGSAVFLANPSGTVNILARDNDPAPGGGTYSLSSSIDGLNATLRVSSDSYLAFTALSGPTGPRTTFVGSAAGTMRWITQ